MLQIVGTFILEGVAGTAGSCPERAAALDYEFFDDAVEVEPVVVALLREIGKTCDGDRRLSWEEFQIYRSLFCSIAVIRLSAGSSYFGLDQDQ